MSAIPQNDVVSLLATGMVFLSFSFSGCGFSGHEDDAKILQATFLEAIDVYEQAEASLSLQSNVVIDLGENEKLARKRAVQNEFRRVASMYQGLLDQGVESGAILYNQGNAWYRAGEPARAIASYRKAQRYLPNNPYLAANLKTVAISGSPAERSSFWTALLFWQNSISYPMKFHLSLAATLFAFTAALFALFRREKIYTKLAILLTATACLAIFSTLYDWHRFDRTEYGVVLAEHTVVRKGNSPHYEAAFAEPVRKRTEFTVGDKRGQWILARFAGGESGWVPAGDVVVY